MGAASLAISPSKSRSFDFGAGWLLVKEAGGVFTDTSGIDISELRIGLEHLTSFIASANIEIHKKALEYLNGSQI
jgi:fructose-1,6-bisphosphatase/inositol monophosphatase family enzyme